MGDLLIHYVTPHEISSVFQQNAAWLNKLQIGGGLYVEMGKQLDWRPLVSDPKTSHPFFDKTFLFVNTVSLLGQSADAITTQRFLKHNEIEGDPLARPFVKYGWPGQIGVAVIVNSAIFTAEYGLHKMGHHRIERGLPLAVGAASGILAYNNLHGQ